MGDTMGLPGEDTLCVIRLLDDAYVKPNGFWTVEPTGFLGYKTGEERIVDNGRCRQLDDGKVRYELLSEWPVEEVRKVLNRRRRREKANGQGKR